MGRVPACWQAVLGKHPTWSVNLKRVRRLLGNVVWSDGDVVGRQEDPEKAEDLKLVEEDVEDWCLITAAPPAVPAGKAGATLARSRRR